MEKIITIETLRSFAYSNHEICKKPIKGVAVCFVGLGGQVMHKQDTKEGILFAEEGILFVIPYQNPWAWQNRQNVAYTDEILDVLKPDIVVHELPGSEKGMMDDVRKQRSLIP